MDKKKLINELKKLLDDKKITNVLTIALVIAFVLIALNVFYPDMFKEKEKVKSTLSEEVETINTKEEYEETQKKELKNILESMSGVGKVQVMINFKSGESKVLAYDSSKQIVSTEEKDTEGGTRVSNQTNDGTTVVMTNEGGDNEPFIVETYKPKIEGIMILAEGASDSKIKYDIQKAVSSLYGLSAEKVNVYPMK
ncbi:MAG: stage III sporulation protein AG [Clostridium sp.]|nr:stage III sporulation protein AG [Clostridium sp.]